MLEIIGFVLASLVGLSLGLLGGGGSILTVPILVYVMAVPAYEATTYSLLIVGITSLVGAGQGYLKNEVNLKRALAFGIPSSLTVFAFRKWFMPAVPDTLLNMGSFVLTKDLAVLILFSVVMIAASYAMLKPKQQVIEHDGHSVRLGGLVSRGVFTGGITGLVGAGGGFLIVPALLFFAHLRMKSAVATSLLIIAANSLIGFTGSIGKVELDYSLLIPFSLLALAGLGAGIFLRRRISADQLKPAFGWFILLVGSGIIIKELSSL